MNENSFKCKICLYAQCLFWLGRDENLSSVPDILLVHHCKSSTQILIPRLIFENITP